MTAKPKLAAAKDWRNRPVETWNTTSFCEYLKDTHKERFGIDYVPFGGWRVEQGMIGNLIGTQSRTAPKPRTASNALVKAFIDECFATYTPNAQYPGTSFGFSFAYRKNVLQRLQAEELAQSRRREAVADTPDIEQLTDWW